MGPHEVLDSARDLYGAHRFYPPNQHPATHRWREHLKRMEELRGQVIDPAAKADLLDTMLYVERQLSAFEAVEWEQKIRYLEAHYR